MNSRTRFLRQIFFSLFFVFVAQARAEDRVRVVTTIPELAWVAEKIGGDQVIAKSLLRGTEDPHYVDALPDFVRRVADADIVCFVGADLEVGWLPKVLSRSGNKTVQNGGAGFCDASRTVELVEKPHGPIDRSMGDVHPGGNPHYWLSPPHLAEAAREIVQAMSRARPEKKEFFRKNFLEVTRKLNELVQSEQVKLKKNSGALLEYHKEFVYLFKAYGLTSLGTLEQIPGREPSARRIADIAILAKDSKARLLVAGPFAPGSALSKFTELSGVPTIKVPTLLKANRDGTPEDYISNHRALIDAID
jgi:zinc/manganese transport system substrate-binding protein